MIIQKDYLNEGIQLPGFGLFYDSPFMEFVREIYDELPRPQSCYPYANNFSIRLQYHRRSVCYSPTYQEGRSASTLCVKGLEPIVGDFERNIVDLSNEGPTNSGQRLLEHFVWTENKLPGAVTLREARLAAEVANRLQKRFSDVHGELARLPLPVFVARHSQESEVKYLALLKRYSNTSTFLRIEEILSGGMGVYGYLYPTPPVRVRHLPAVAVSNPIQSRLEVLQAREGVIPCIQAWVDLFCQLLQLGYLPTSTASRWTGSSCDAGNAVIDGGFVDLESFVAVDDERILSRISEHLSFAISTLASTIISCAAGEHPSIKNSDLPKSLAYSFVLEACRRNLSRTGFEASPEATAQIFQFINAIHSPSELLALMENFFPNFERAKSICSEPEFRA